MLNILCETCFDCAMSESLASLLVASIAAISLVPQAHADPKLTMKVDGKDWTALPSTVFGATGIAGLPATSVTISGDSDEKKTHGLTILLNTFKGPGEYTCEPKTEQTKFMVQYHDGLATNPFQARHIVTNNKGGEKFVLNITKASGTDIEGTFSGTVTTDDGTKVLKITDGVFDTE